MTNTTRNTSLPAETDGSPSFSEGTGVAAPKKSPARFITPILALVAALGIGLFGGVLIGQNTATSSQSSGPGQGQGGPGGTAGDAPTGGGMGGFTSGTVTAVDGDTVTLKLTDGSTVKVTTTADTTVTTTKESAVGDLAEGDTLTVMGEADSDGNVAATSITEGATGFGGGMGGGGTPPTGTGTN